MEFFDNIRVALLSTQANDQTVRKNAEEEIKNCRDQDPRKFMATLTRDIADESLDVAARQMACIIFKNFITNRTGEQKYEGYWVSLDVEFRG